MYTLVSSKSSPYGRKVRIVADCLGLTVKMRLQHANTQDENDPLRDINPLGKIPALIPDNENPIFDSRVICDYLETMHGKGDIIPLDPAKRFRELTLAALAEGINDALILITYERRYRDEEQVGPRWMAHQHGKLERSLAKVTDTLDEFTVPGIAATTLACALGYADWRKQIDWRAEFPTLIDWLDDYAKQVPAFDRTVVPEGTP